jgi:hypothetical protein
VQQLHRLAKFKFAKTFSTIFGSSIKFWEGDSKNELISVPARTDLPNFV